MNYVSVKEKCFWRYL